MSPEEKDFPRMENLWRKKSFSVLIKTKRISVETDFIQLV